MAIAKPPTSEVTVALHARAPVTTTPLSEAQFSRPSSTGPTRNVWSRSRRPGCTATGSSAGTNPRTQSIPASDRTRPPTCTMAAPIRSAGKPRHRSGHRLPRPPRADLRAPANHSEPPALPAFSRDQPTTEEDQPTNKSPKVVKLTGSGPRASDSTRPAPQTTARLLPSGQHTARINRAVLDGRVHDSDILGPVPLIFTESCDCWRLLLATLLAIACTSAVVGDSRRGTNSRRVPIDGCEVPIT